MSKQRGITYGPDQPLRIIALEKTCPAFPAQWNGETEHHATVYIRYRNGHLTVRVGPDLDTALERSYVWEWQSDDYRDGSMSLAELTARLPGWIVIADGTEAEAQEGDGA